MGIFDSKLGENEKRIRGWPKGNEAADFEKLTKPLVRAVRFAYKLNRQNEDKDIPWKGLDIGWRERATCLSPETQLSAERLRYSDEEQGRDALEEIIGLALRIGIEQGRRITMTGPTIQTLEIEAMLGRVIMADKKQEMATKSDDPAS
jgi:hypothetical protein